MDNYLIIKTIHILSSTVLFGTGLGIAFFMYISNSANNIHEKYYAVRKTVLADFIFTFPAVIIQPVTGFWLLWHSGIDLHAFWLQITYIGYVVAGLCWLPVVWIQIQLKNMLKQAIVQNKPLPDRYDRLFKIWFILGWPAFIALLIIFFMMVFKPV